MTSLPPTKKVVFKGFKLKVYSIGWLALLTNRTSWTVRRWESLGMLPQPVLNFSQGAKRYSRWYTAAELLAYSEIFKKSNVKTKTPIQETTFGQNCSIFRAHIYTRMKTNPHILGDTLKGEETILQVHAKNRAAKWQKQVRHLMPS